MDLNSKIFIPLREITIWRNDKKMNSFFTLHQYLGTFPYKVVNGRIRSGRNFMWCIIVDCYLILLYLLLIFKAPKLRSDAKISAIINYAEITMQMFTIVGSTIILFKFKNKFYNYFELISKDVNTVQFGKSNRITVFNISTAMFLILFQFYAESDAILSRPTNYAMYYSTEILAMSVVGQLCGLLVSIENKLSLMANSLNNHLYVDYLSLLKKYERITKICEDINVLYAFQMLIVVQKGVILLLTLTYNAIVYVMGGRLAQAASYEMWAVSCWMLSFRLAYSCFQVTKQLPVRKFSIVVLLPIGLYEASFLFHSIHGDSYGYSGKLQPRLFRQQV
ncbi:hypothetical protein O3M35_011731 [Rhynocoris fuscipes]|uniref:Odorant receptor n=1 Tax=Rhynocoris fuscipes TaxID=488301 RepID=A0AAW1D422_9HEMI